MDAPLHCLFPSDDKGNPPKLSSLTHGQLAIAQINGHLAYHERQISSATSKTSGAKPLTAIASEKIVSTLRYDTAEGISVLSSSCPPQLLRGILENPRLHYTAFRALGLIHDSEFQEQIQRKMTEDIDVWILKNEKFIRLPTNNTETQMAMLVTLADSDVLFPGSKLMKDEYRLITRKDPPRESFPILDAKRPRTIKIQPSTDAFKKTFTRLTNNIFEGLDWNNVCIAGGMVLSTLLCVDQSMDKQYLKNDIDLYIYGLTPEEANKKIREIYEVWRINLGARKKIFLVKNSKTINFISDYPERRIQIVLKLVSSPAEVLLNFDLDPCAVAYDGKDVLMLPRAARALETGYSTFTMDLIHGHHLGDRRATQETRAFKYASRGFGILIHSSLLRTVSINFGNRLPRLLSMRQWGILWKLEGRGDPKLIIKGKKAVKTIAFLADDMVRRFYIGQTKFATPLKDREDYDEQNDYGDGNEWDGRVFVYENGDDVGEESSSSSDKKKADENPKKIYIYAKYSDLNGNEQHLGQPGGRSGLGTFEVFMRLVSLWNLECEDLVRIAKDSFASTTYDDQSYDDMPKYEWNEKFDSKEFAKKIDAYNDEIFEDVKYVVEELSDVSATSNPRWGGYLTRRIRRMIHAKDINELFEKQITLPVIVPKELEDYIATTMYDFSVENPRINTRSDEYKILIPAHNPAKKGTSNVRSLPESNKWNLRMWVIGNETMWARKDRRIDEIFEVLWVFYHLQHLRDRPNHQTIDGGDEEDSRAYLFTLASQFDRRIIPASSFKLPSSSSNKSPTDWPDAREKELFERWLMEKPLRVGGRHYSENHHPMFEGDFVENERIPEDELFWDPEEDGADDGGVWREVATDDDDGGGGGDDDDRDDRDERFERFTVGHKRKRVDSGIPDSMVS